MYASQIQHGPVFIHLDDTRRDLLSHATDEKLTHLVIDITSKTYTFHGEKGKTTYTLPHGFTQEIAKLGGSFSADLAWALFRRVVLDEQITVTPSVHFNTALTDAIIRSATAPASHTEENEFESILLKRYVLFELLLQTRSYLESLDVKIEKRKEEKAALEQELTKTYKTIDAQKKAISQLSPAKRKEALYELDSMKLQSEYITRQITTVNKALQRQIAERATIEEQGIHLVPEMNDHLDPEVIQTSKQVAQKQTPFLFSVEKEIEEATHNALILIEKGKL